MLAQVKKVVGGDVAGRFGAWWNGRDYVPPPADAEAAPDAEAKAAAPAKAPAKEPEPAPAPAAEPVVEAADADLFEETPATVNEPALDQRLASSGTPARLKALETIWGEGRFAPGSDALDMRLLELVFGAVEGAGDIGFMGVDGALLKACAMGSDKPPRVVEWRTACVDRLRELAPNAVVSASDLDRPRGFDDGQLEGLVSIEAFAFADHKAGMVGRIFRSLSETGRWVFLDTSRRTKKTPAEAFASAWAEPQLSTADEIEELLKLAGFRNVRRESASELVLAAARQGYAQLAGVLEKAATGGLTGREGAIFLQELAWEAQSWRARCRALEGGALSVDIWIADKKGEPALDQDSELTLAISDAVDEAPPAIVNEEIDA